jgi:hypothetical protein
VNPYKNSTFLDAKYFKLKGNVKVLFVDMMLVNLGNIETTYKLEIDHQSII